MLRKGNESGVMLRQSKAHERRDAESKAHERARAA